MVVILTISRAASDDKVVNMTVFLFQCDNWGAIYAYITVIIMI